MSDKFRRICSLLSERLTIHNQLLTNIKEQLILHDLSTELGTQVNTGRSLVSGFDWIDELSVGGEVVNLISKQREKYSAYVVYTKKDYYTMGLGIQYKKEIISPHMDFCVERVITQYNASDLKEIAEQINGIIRTINIDIDYLQTNSDVCYHEHYYGEYNGGFKSRNRFETISDVIRDYKK